jgi:hypothetical protein
LELFIKHTHSTISEAIVVEGRGRGQGVFVKAVDLTYRGLNQICTVVNSKSINLGLSRWKLKLVDYPHTVPEISADSLTYPLPSLAKAPETVE